MTPFRRSRTVTLLITGGVAAALTGCGSSSTSDRDGTAVPEKIVAPESWNDGSVVRVNPATVSTNQVYYNNTYAHGIGYYHAGVGHWFPFPYGFNRPGLGYFANGLWGDTKPVGTIPQSHPLSTTTQSLNRSEQASDSSESAKRGGFGSSGHGGHGGHFSFGG